MEWGLQEKQGPFSRVPKALRKISGDRSGCRQEKGAVIWVLMEAGEMLLGSLRQATKCGGGRTQAPGVLGGQYRGGGGIC